MEVSGQAGGGLVQVTLSGKFEMRALKIDPSLFKEDDVEVLEDLILGRPQRRQGEARCQHAAEDPGTDSRAADSARHETAVLRAHFHRRHAFARNDRPIRQIGAAGVRL